MSDNLKDAAESGFRIYGEKIQAPFSNEDLTGLLEAYTSRILASQQAAHDAEIAKLKEENKTLRMEQFDLLAANIEANAACAMKDEALTLAQISSCSCLTKTNEPAHHSEHCLYRVLAEAISASPQQVSEWERKQLAEAEQRGAVKALEDAACWFEKNYSSGDVPAKYIRKLIGATSKKAG